VPYLQGCRSDFSAYCISFGLHESDVISRTADYRQQIIKSRMSLILVDLPACISVVFWFSVEGIHGLRGASDRKVIAQHVRVGAGVIRTCRSQDD
jgi:hypothetical protein